MAVLPLNHGLRVLRDIPVRKLSKAVSV
jgi:hypothetical protein